MLLRLTHQIILPCLTLVVFMPGPVLADLYPEQEVHFPFTESPFCEDRDNARFGRTVAVGDIDNDGFHDMIVYREGPTTSDRAVHVFYGTVSGQMEYNGYFDQSGGSITSIALVDLNSDGGADVILGQGRDLRVYYGAPSPNRLPSSTAPTPDWSCSVPYTYSSAQPTEYASAGDLDGDGYEDLVAMIPTFPGIAFAVHGFSGMGGDAPSDPKVILTEQFRRIRNSVGDANGDGIDEWGEVFTDPASGQPTIKVHGSRRYKDLMGWGQNSSGQVGTGSTSQQLTPFAAFAGFEWLDMAAGNSHSLAVRSDGTLWAWGDNSSGQLGIGSNDDQSSPVQIGSSTTWRQVACGSAHSLALDQDGSIYAWGSNSYGQLGRADLVSQSEPVRVGVSPDWTCVSAGRSFSLGIKDDGSLWAWGRNHHGQLGDGTTSDRHAPFLVDDTAKWLMVDGGSNHTVALREDGTLWTWGGNSSGQLGDGTNDERHVPGQISPQHVWAFADAAHYGQFNAALRSDGTLWTWGSSGSAVPEQVGTENDWWRVSAGYVHVLALKRDGTLWGWGSNFYGQLGDGSTNSQNDPIQIGSETGWAEIRAGYAHSLALRDPVLDSWQVTGVAGETSDRFGEQIGSAGDLDGDGYGDIFITDPGYGSGSSGSWGRVHIWYGGPCGTRPCDREAGLPRDPTPSTADHLIGPDGYNGADRFVAAGDIDGNGYDDLAVADPHRLSLCSDGQSSRYVETGMVQTFLSRVWTEAPVVSGRTVVHACRPNPFNPRTTVVYELSRAGQASLQIFDVRGRLVRDLEIRSQAQGLHEVTWDGSDGRGRAVSSGTYYCRLQFGETTSVAKLALIR